MIEPVQQASVRVLRGDCVEVMREMPENSVDSVVCDPPYELGFMGKSWDNTGVAYRVETWTAALRVLKPGGYLLAFGGTRTVHRLACAIEDAGFEIRDTIQWIYGSGFPKSHNISKAMDKMAGAERTEVIGSKLGRPGMAKDGSNQSFDSSKNTYGSSGVLSSDITAPATEEAKRWEGWGSALKPAHEPIIMARKPLAEKNLASNVLKWGTGGLNIDESRISHNEPEKLTTRTVGKFAGNAYAKDDYSVNMDGGKLASPAPTGRFPANLLLSHSPGCQQVGSKRVKGNTRKDKGNYGGTFGNGQPVTNEQWQDADPDGTEEVADYICEDSCPVRLLDEQSGVSKAHSSRRKPAKDGNEWEGWGSIASSPVDVYAGYKDQGGASRYFRTFDTPGFKYQAKAPRSERGYYLKCNCETVKLEAWLKPDLSPSEKTALISQLRATSERTTDESSDTFTMLSGKSTTGLSPKATKSTTSTKISSITESRTFNSSPQQNTNGYIADANSGTENGGSPVRCAENSSPSQKSTGTSQEKDGRSTGVAVHATFPRSSLTKNCAECGSEIKTEGHPTQKPVKLLSYLCKLVTPPGGTVLDCFAGSGTTGVAALSEGFNAILIEQDEEYADIAEARCAHALNEFSGRLPL